MKPAKRAKAGKAEKKQDTNDQSDGEAEAAAVRRGKGRALSPRESGKGGSGGDSHSRCEAAGAKIDKEKPQKSSKKGNADVSEAPSGPGGGTRPRGGEEVDKRAKLKVHIARFFEYQPQIVTAMAYDAESEMLAVARGSGDIQLWRTVAPRWHAVGNLTGSSSSQIRSVCWARTGEGESPRLFSGSLDGAVTEWSLQTMGPVSVTDSQGGSVWCLAVSHSGDRLAAACHDGGVRIFDVAEHVPGVVSSEGFVFRQLLPRHPGEALSVAWGHGDRVLVTGDSQGMVRVWQLGKERSGLPPTVQTVSIATNLGNGGMKKTSLVWAVAVHADLTVWAADSKGNSTVIDARMGLVVKRFMSHHGSDVLTLSTHGLNDCFSGGVDGRVVHYRRVNGNGSSQVGGQWVVAGSARFHTHDIRCLCLAGQFYSAGADETRAAEIETGKRILKADPSGRKMEALNLQSLQQCIVSAGLDTQLCLYTYDLPYTASTSVPRAITPSMRLPPWPFQSCISVSGAISVCGAMKQQGEDAKACEVRMLAWQAHVIDLWRWKVTSRGSLASPSPSPHSSSTGTAAEREWVDEPRYAVRIETAVGGGRVACASISHDGQWIACALSSRLAIYRVHDKADGGLDVVKSLLPKVLEQATVGALAFSPDSTSLIISQTDGNIRSVSLDPVKMLYTLRAATSSRADTTGVIRKAPPTKVRGEADGRVVVADGQIVEGDVTRPSSVWNSTAVNRMCVSGDGKWLATCDMGGLVLAWCLPTAAIQTHTSKTHTKDDPDTLLPISIPALPGGVTAMRFRPVGEGGAASTNLLVLVTAENKVYIFKTEKKKLIALHQHVSSAACKDKDGKTKPNKSSSLLLHPHHCHSMTFNPRHPSQLILWG